MHVTWLCGAAKLLADARSTWRGTLMAVFQPGEETAEGAQAMTPAPAFRQRNLINEKPPFPEGFSYFQVTS
ncbi:hypothetical protein [Citrifermentans pelophilum]|uniref:hypothetical protein n=1 Tax=Geoanaerobacter pelophilus TaxID=60036 RepID=UPI001F2FFD9E|nr:hypothetical protein [Geoanaerobacter pelophilus]